MESDDEMFPGEGPSTPRHAPKFPIDPSSELSPPNSQGRFSQTQDDSLSALVGGAASTINANGKRIRSSAKEKTTSEISGGQSGPVQTDPTTGYQWTQPEDQPGHAWRNNRAREDEMRALDMLVDRGSQIKSKETLYPPLV